MYETTSLETSDPLKVRLTKRYAEMINGVDLCRVRVGDVLDLSPRDAGILLAEGWALPVDAGTPEHEAPRRADSSDGSRTRH